MRTGGARRRPLPEPPRSHKGKERADPNGRGGGHEGFYDHIPLTEWPPSGHSSSEELSKNQAVELISRGVPHFKGHKRRIPHASDQYYGLYATVSVDDGKDNDATDPRKAMIQLMTLRMMGHGSPVHPWETLEQPSMACGFGRRPGTITLNRYVSFSSVVPASMLRDAGAARREVKLRRIFERLSELESSVRDTDEQQMYNKLYRQFLRDPDRLRNPHRPIAKQIEDLVLALSSADFVDLTNPRNQVVTKFIYDAAAATESEEGRAQYTSFFYQLLLALELDLRINSPVVEGDGDGGNHTDGDDDRSRATRERLIALIPPRIQWNLALARRWRHNIRVEDWGDDPVNVKLKFRLRKRQSNVLQRFARLMKWPNLNATIDAIVRRDARGTSVSVSSHAMAFFSGLVLPGVSSSTSHII